MKTRAEKSTIPLSEQEQLAAQGTAYADLKAAKTKVATLNLVLTDYAEWLRETAQLVDKLVRDPAHQADSCTKLADYLKHSVTHGVTPAEIAARIEELTKETARATQLHEQIANF